MKHFAVVTCTLDGESFYARVHGKSAIVPGRRIKLLRVAACGQAGVRTMWVANGPWFYVVAKTVATAGTIQCARLASSLREVGQ